MAAMRRQDETVRDALPLSVAAAAAGGRVHGADISFTGASADSRGVRPGELFIALRGARVDGHDFLAVAHERKAAAALVDHVVDFPIPQIVVADTHLALGQIAARWRAQYNFPMIGLTGSNGKTTVKELLAAILSRCGETLATQGNFNNDIGMPLTLLRMRSTQRFAVIEMGANHPGEIGHLTSLAQPDVALINNAGPAHLEGFGTVEGVAHAKGEIYTGLKSGGVAIINNDDRYAPLWETLVAGRRVVRFGLQPGADVRGEWVGDAISSRLHLQTPLGNAHATLHLPGKHNVLNALAATASAIAVGAGLPDIILGLESAQPPPGRLQAKSGRSGAHIIDDTYNANPASVQAALNVLAACGGRRVFVLGDLAELGDDTVELHRSVGAAAARAGIDALYTVGTLSVHAAHAFSGEHTHFATQDELIAALLPALADHVTVLIKGSRSAHMERCVEALISGEPQ